MRLSFSLALLAGSVYGQVPTDTAGLARTQALADVVVTATRSEQLAASVPIPVTVITSRQLQQMGSLRLSEVLVEQTGIALTSDHGTGVQLQGFGADYTLILVDGEPIIGRVAGTLDLSRLAVGNIRRIEIVKGPSSALYGSEAMGGVINLITAGSSSHQPPGRYGSARVRYGANHTTDLTADFGLRREKLGLYAFANRYASGGYALLPGSGSPTIPPFANYTFNTRFTYRFTPRTDLLVSGRYFAESQRNYFVVSESGQARRVDEAGRVGDYNALATLTHRLSDKLKATARLYHTGYRTDAALTYAADGRAYDASFFRQLFTRAELVGEYAPHARHALTGGVGYIAESVAATRFVSQPRFTTRYAFLQHEWRPWARLVLVSGARLDAHSQYAGQVSPKLSAQYAATNWLKVRASVGRGFKAPDFRQLFLNFTNAVAGYSVFGANEVAAALAQLQQQGQIARVLVDPANIGTIRAESSWATNVGVLVEPNTDLKISLNAFHNEVSDLIETLPIAQKTNGQAVFSYFNLNRVFTQGAELDGSYRLAKGLTLSVGYQYLVAKDRAALDALAAGQVFARDPQTLVTERVRGSQYGGLFNRSRHMANVKLFYEGPHFNASLRGIYRGRYGFGDLNGNQILDAANEYVRGYVTCNAAVAKTFRQLTAQAGVDNLLDYTDAAYIPTLPGRLWYASVAWRFGQP